MKTYYYLQIASDDVPNSVISNILGVKSNYPEGEAFWKFLLNKKLGKTSFVKRAIQLLEGKFEKLKSIGIERNDISVWMLYESTKWRNNYTI